MTRGCRYPGCRNHASTTWALVPVCLQHRELIWKETTRFYARRITAEEREHYMKIRHMTPWG
jgi:hypothetical protein